MVSELHVSEFLPAHALGNLDGEEAVRVAEHLANCSECRAEIQPYLEVAGQLALAAPEVVPPARVKQHLMRRIDRQRTAPKTAQGPSWWQQWAGFFRRAAPAWALASVFLIVALGASTIWLWQQVNGGGAGRMHVVALVATDASPGATGKLVISTDGEYGTLVVDGLSPLDAGHQYQLWLSHDGQRTNGGVFSVNQSGYGVLEITAPQLLTSYPSFGITAEPAGGSTGPTGEEVLTGSP